MIPALLGTIVAQFGALPTYLINSDLSKFPTLPNEPVEVELPERLPSYLSPLVKLPLI